MSDFKCDQMDKCQGDCGPWCTGYNRALAIQKLDEVKEEIESTNTLTAQGMIKLVEVFKCSMETKTPGQMRGDALRRVMSGMLQEPKVNEKEMRRLLCQMGDTFVLKNKNYGNSFEISLDKYGLIAALTRLSDKFNRAETLILNHDAGTDDESVMDTLLDLATYCVMTACYMEGVKGDFEESLKNLEG